MPKKQINRRFTEDDIELFMGYMELRGLAHNTILSYSKDIRSFLADCGGEIETVDYSRSASYWLTRNRSRLAAKTLGRHLCSLKCFAKWGQIPNELSDFKQPVALRSDPHPLPEGIDGVFRMIDACTRRDHATMIALLGLCGLRISESRTIRASSINRDANIMTVRGKGDKSRKVPVSDHAWGVIEMSFYESYVNNDQRMILINDRSARAAVTDIAKRAGLKRRVSSHDLRATFATEIFNKTHNLRVVQELLGHGSVAVTEQYLGVNDEQMRDAVNVL